VDALVPGSALTIGDVARRTGVPQATLRVWEQRYGFPVPLRLESGHRRYSVADVDTVLDVLRRRDAGTRLDAAVVQAVRQAGEGPQVDVQSAFAGLRRRHPHLAVRRLRKSTLSALSWAFEDEFGARAEKAYLFGGFQRQEFLTTALPRWTELSRVARAAYVFAEGAEPNEGGPVAVRLGDDTPLLREWVVICDAPGFAVALVAWELPGQATVPDRARTFEVIWTLEPPAVRDCARVCAQVALEAGAPGAAAVHRAMAADAPSQPSDDAASAALFGRAVAYLDRVTAGPETVL